MADVTGDGEGPQPGDFRVVPVGGWGGLGIEVGQLANGEGWTRHDHAEVYLGGGQVASAHPSGPGIRPYTEVAGAVWSSGVIALTDGQRAGIVGWCREHADVRYGWTDYAALTLHRLRVNDPALKRRIGSSGRLICSQYVDLAYNAGGDVHLFDDGRWPGYVTPEMLAVRVGAR